MALTVEVNANHAEQRSEIMAQGESICAEMNARFAEMNRRINVLIAVVITWSVAQFGALIAFFMRG